MSEAERGLTRFLSNSFRRQRKMEVEDGSCTSTCGVWLLYKHDPTLDGESQMPVRLWWCNVLDRQWFYQPGVSTRAPPRRNIAAGPGAIATAAAAAAGAAAVPISPPPAMGTCTQGAHYVMSVDSEEEYDGMVHACSLVVLEPSALQ